MDLKGEQLRLFRLALSDFIHAVDAHLAIVPFNDNI